MTLKAPFIWPGGKSKVGDVIWRAFDPRVPNYVEPFAGTVAVLLRRPGGAGKIETINDLDCDVANFWRATIAEPEAVAERCDWPVNEADLHAVGAKMIAGLEEHRARMHSDPDYYDTERAGWWVWGQCTSINNGFMQNGHARALPRMTGWLTGNGIHASLPAIGHSGRGVHGPKRQGLVDWFCALRARLRGVRVACGDWSRVCSGAVTGASKSLKDMGMSPCAVFLDPPYGDTRRSKMYSEDSATVHKDVFAWAVEHGDDPHFRIAVCGYEGEHEFPETWVVHAWKAQGGHGNRNKENVNPHRERIWFSPHCLPVQQQQSLFENRRAW